MFACNWFRKIQRWWSPSVARPRLRRRTFSDRGAMIGRMQCLEQRQLLANVVEVNVSSKGISLVDTQSQTATKGDEFDMTYTGSQVTLTAKNGTQFDVDGTLKTTHTFTTTTPLPLFIALNAPGNKLTITGDGQASLKSIEVRFGNKPQANSLTPSDNSLTLNKVIADSFTVVGRLSNTDVTVQQSTINGVVRGLIGKHDSSSFTLDQTTIHGAVRTEGKQLTINQSTIDGAFIVLQKASDSTLTTTASTYKGSVAIAQGPKGIINVNASANGANKFEGTQRIKGRNDQNITMNVATHGAVNAIPPTLVRVDSKTITPPTAPTVDAASFATTPGTVTGNWDSVRAKTLKVTAGDKTYTLGTDAAMTSPSTGKWSLSLTGVTLPTGENTVTAVNTDAQGNTTQGTGKITLTTLADQQQTAIQTFLTANQLTATKTASGLNYVIVTQGTGAIPQTGHTLSVNYTGTILNSNGTLGTKFDSNVDPQFNHVQPFTFPLGQGRVIAGWDEAFKLLPVGTVAKLLIPSALGYGTAGSNNIPPDSILVFDVTLVSAQ